MSPGGMSGVRARDGAGWLTQRHLSVGNGSSNDTISDVTSTRTTWVLSSSRSKQQLELWFWTREFNKLEKNYVNFSANLWSMFHLNRWILQVATLTDLFQTQTTSQLTLYSTSSFFIKCCMLCRFTLDTWRKVRSTCCRECCLEPAIEASLPIIMISIY